jgi:hypothetical protein
MTMIDDSKEAKKRFAAAMAALYKAHGLQPDREQTAIYHEAIKGEICMEAFELAARQSLKLDERFPKIPRLLELGRRWSPPRLVADLSRPALAEFTETQHEEAAKRLDALLAGFSRWGTA